MNVADAPLPPPQDGQPSALAGNPPDGCDEMPDSDDDLGWVEDAAPLAIALPDGPAAKPGGVDAAPTVLGDLGTAEAPEGETTSMVVQEKSEDLTNHEALDKISRVVLELKRCS